MIIVTLLCTTKWFITLQTAYFRQIANVNICWLNYVCQHRLWTCSKTFFFVSLSSPGTFESPRHIFNYNLTTKTKWVIHTQAMWELDEFEVWLSCGGFLLLFYFFKTNEEKSNTHRFDSNRWYCGISSVYTNPSNVRVWFSASYDKLDTWIWVNYSVHKK